MPHPNVSLPNILISWGAAFVVFGAVLLLPSLSQSRLLINPFAAFFGKISYSFYLAHGLVAALIFSIVMPFGIGVLLTFLLSIILSYAMYRWVERPGVAAGRWLSQAMQLRDVKLLSLIVPTPVTIERSERT
jgi:peptidoglycan/LPS O-acetylase OafA/YrhL